MVRSEDIAGGVLVGSRKNIDARLVRMAPGFVDSQEIVLVAFPSGGKRHGHVLAGCKRGLDAPLGSGSVSGGTAWADFPEE